MKNLKKLTTLLLALLMVFALSATAFATGETGTITVDNPVAGQTYTAYKIFDVVYNTEKSAYSYTIAGNSEWSEVVMNADGSSKITGLTFEKAFSEDIYVVTKSDAFSAAEFANTLKAAVAGKTGETLTLADGKATITGLELGYYFVTSISGALCNLTTTNPSVTIHDKNDVPFDKVDDKNSVEIGDTVTYTITGKVPDSTGFDTFDYVITDKMSTGLTFNNDIKIYISDDATLDTTADRELAAAYYTKTTENARTFDNTEAVDFNISFRVIDMNNANPSLVGKYIFITYTATVNENAAGKIEKNKATLTYSNDPADNTSHGTQTKEQTVYSAKIVIDKYAADPNDENDKSTKLAGAKFVLYRNVTETVGGVETTARQYYKYTEPKAAEGGNPAVAADVAWVTDKAQATEVTTGNDGAANFDGLKDGTYYLEETAAPAGYNLLKDPVEITIDGASATETDLSTLTHTEGVANNTGTLLPSTGGIGTKIFYVVGSVLLVGAAVLLITKKRMSVTK